MDDCFSEPIVVGAADNAKAKDLVSQFDHYAVSPDSTTRCTLCIPPPVQVTCVNQKCVGAIALDTLPDGGKFEDFSLRADHCGSVPGVPVKPGSGPILGCGGG
jgi:hypothetical protein